MKNIWTATHRPSKVEPAEQHTRRMHSGLVAPIAAVPAAVEPAKGQAHRVERHQLPVYRQAADLQEPALGIRDNRSQTVRTGSAAAFRTSANEESRATV